MASTYVNNLRLNEMATGDGSGTWGTTTNTNLELIGQALGYGTRAIANASTDNITIADGASDSDRAMYLKLTGGGQACAVTLLPNTASKVWMMENATSYTLTFTCGSGANVAILAGETKVIATDGAGGGGVVYDVLTDTNLAGHTKVDDLTVGDDLVVGGDIDLEGAIDVNGTANLDVVDIDGAVNMATTALVTGVLTTTATQVATGGITSGSSILSDTDSTDSLGSTGVRWLKGWFDTLTAGTLTIGSGSVTDSSGAISFGNENLTTTGIVTAAGTSVFTNLDISGDVDVDGTINLDAVDIDGAVQLDSTFTVGVDGTGHDVKFFGDTASAYMLWDQSTDDLILGGASRLGVGTTTPAAPLNVKVSADGTLVRLSRHGVCDWDVSIGNTSTLSGVGAGALEFLPQNGGTPNEFAIGKAGTTTAIFHATVDGITMPLQPAFNAYPASAQSNIAIDTTVTIVLGTEAFDVGANFASNTFTAPVTGKYQLNLELMVNAVDSAAGFYQIQIVTSNKSYNMTFDPNFAADMDYWCFTNSVLADMDASDTAIVKIYQSGGTAQTDIDTGTVFSGYLVC